MRYHPIAALVSVIAIFGSTARGQTPQDLLANVEQAWKGIRDYQCKMQSNNKLGQEKDMKQIEFWFKRNHQVRMEVLDGKNKGSLLTRNDRGRIKGKKGGILRLVTVTLDDTDERILNLRGRKFYEADWGTILSEFAERTKAGWKVEIVDEEKVGGTPCRVLVATGSETESRVSKDMMWIDKKSHLILRRKQYEGENLVNEVLWWDIRLNSGLSDDLFSL